MKPSLHFPTASAAMDHVKGSAISSAHLGLIALIVMFGGLRLWDLTTYGLWLDEILTVKAARLGADGLIAYAIQDVVHPPLFYFVVKVWMIIGGQSLIWLKLLPLLFALGSIVPLCLLARELGLNRFETSLTLALVALNSYLIFYAQELRMYSLTMFLSLLSLWLFVRFVNFKTAVPVALFLVNLLLVYTHYYGWLVVLVEFAFLLIRRRQKVLSFGTLCGLLVLSSIPWAYLVFKSSISTTGVKNLEWISRPQILDVVVWFGTLGGLVRSRPLMALSVAIFAITIVLWTIKKKDSEESDTWWLLALMSFLPVIVAFVASYVLPNSVWHSRYLIIAAAPYLLLVSVSVSRLRPYWLKVSILVFVLGMATVAGINGLRNNERIAWNTLVEQLVANEPGPTAIYSFGEEQSATPLEYYLEAIDGHRFQVVRVQEVPTHVGEHFWIVYRKSREKKDRRSPETLLKERGYSVDRSFSSGQPGHEVFLLYLTRKNSPQG